MNVPIPALMAAATALLMAQAAHAAPIGNPFATIGITSLDEALNIAPPGIFRTTDADGLPLAAAVNQPAGPSRTLGSAFGTVYNNGATFWLSGFTPSYSGAGPRDPGTPVGATGTLDIYQSYRRDSAASTMSFVYSAARLDLYRDVEVGTTCDNCILAQVGWSAEVYLNDASFTPLWSQSQNARLVDDNGVLTFSQPDPTNSGTGLVNPPWEWRCARCGGTSLGTGSAILQAPYRGLVDLSAIPFDPNLPAGSQPEFTVHYTMTLQIYDQGRWGNASAFTRDPLDPENTGVGFEVSGLTPTDNPAGVVPEPGTWALMLAGVASLGWRLRRRLRRGGGKAACAVLLPLALAAPAAQAQALLTERYATAWGYFIIGYRLLSDSGEEEITRNDLQATDAFEVFDSGEVSGSQLGNPVYGIANFRSALAHDFQPGHIAASGSTQLYAAGSQEYVLAGGRAGSNTRFVFTLEQPIAYTLTLDLHGTSTDPRDLLLAGSFGFDGGSSLHSFSGIGHWEVSGILNPGDYGISARATAYNNQSGDYSYSLVLGAVPEPASWAMALAGLAVVGGLLHRRRPENLAKRQRA